MLRPIHGKTGYSNADDILDLLSGMKLNQDREDYLEALTLFVEDYENAQVPAGANPSPPDAPLLEENRISGSGLAEVLGVSRTLAVKILSGGYRLTVAQTAKLTERFKVSAALFFA